MFSLAGNPGHSDQNGKKRASLASQSSPLHPMGRSSHNPILVFSLEPPKYEPKTAVSYILQFYLTYGLQSYMRAQNKASLCFCTDMD